ncbi:hypothetical protein J437_LFUL002348 [Ladona fulva]|uniref:Uncharacterized protein n=1 Tax=Ladona fulva TaxID=123851 RepID=A0A8K0P219_LADFU|nr:hypothetical protein J437_LFUL002348 [Ladona fulva]
MARVQSGNNGDGAGEGGANGTNAAANSSKQRSMVVVLPERRHSITSKSEEKNKSLKSGQSLGGPRPSTAIGSKGSNIVDKGKKEEANGEAEEEDEELKRPQFKTAKERECWELYQRMCEKGLSVSYDTILRGMLTPTEYRMRRNALLSTC